MVRVSISGISFLSQKGAAFDATLGFT